MMTEMILLSLLLLMVHLFLATTIAMASGQATLTYLLSSRDDAPSVSAMVRRAQRASMNLLETLPAFLVLAVLSVIKGVDNLWLAQAWLVLRVVYVLFYLAGTPYLRSVVWIAALGCLIAMALALF